MLLYIIDILRGEKQEQIIARKHDKLSTWAIGKEYSKEQWCYLALQLFQNNFFKRSAEDGSLHLTDKGQETNKRNVKHEARFWGFPVDSVNMDLETCATVKLDTYESTFEEQNDYDSVLYEKLRDKRRKVAEAEQIKASRVVPLDSLKEMAIQLPQTVDAFSQIRGIGKVRMKYSDDFLSIIRVYCKEHEADAVERKTEIIDTYESASEEENEFVSELFELLRDKRNTIADKKGAAAFVVFRDKTLEEMATYFPQNEEAFLQINGVGPVKMEKYADDFLPIIRNYCQEHEID